MEKERTNSNASMSSSDRKTEKNQIDCDCPIALSLASSVIELIMLVKGDISEACQLATAKEPIQFPTGGAGPLLTQHEALHERICAVREAKRPLSAEETALANAAETYASAVGVLLDLLHRQTSCRLGTPIPILFIESIWHSGGISKRQRKVEKRTKPVALAFLTLVKADRGSYFDKARELLFRRRETVIDDAQAVVDDRRGLMVALEEAELKMGK